MPSPSLSASPALPARPASVTPGVGRPTAPAPGTHAETSAPRRAGVSAPVQPRYAAYCAAHGMTPDEMLAHDRARFPGGPMAGYQTWLAERATAFTAGLPGRDWLDRMKHVDPAAFDDYLRTGVRP